MAIRQYTILLIEDNENLQNINQTALEMSGYKVITAYTLSDGQHMIDCYAPDLILLDIMMPDGNGIDFCRELRGTSKIPILFLSALGRNTDIIAGLTAGGDDYLPKPYDLDVLTAKIEALLRRVAYDIGETFYCHKEFKVDFSSRQLYYGPKKITLKPREYEVLEFLIKNRERFVSSDELYRSVWNMGPEPDTRTVKTHIYSLRKKLFVFPKIPFTIQWIKGKGYQYIEL